MTWTVAGSAKLAAWATLAPGANESAGKRKKAAIRNGNPHLRSAMVEAAWAVSRTASRPGARFRRLARRFGTARRHPSLQQGNLSAESALRARMRQYVSAAGARRPVTSPTRPGWQGSSERTGVPGRRSMAESSAQMSDGLE